MNSQNNVAPNASASNLTASQAALRDNGGRRSHVEEETDTTNAIANRLHTALIALSERIEKVVSPAVSSVQSAASAVAAPSPYRVPLAQKVRDTNALLHSLAVGTEDLLSRIEL